MDVRIRLPEVIQERGLTAYEVAKRSKGRIIPSTLYRLSRSMGRVRMIDGELLEALCDILDVEPFQLLEREPKGRGKRR